MKAEFLNQEQKLEPFVMGTYGIGVSRLLSGIIEQNHDSRGCIWTKESAPFMIDIIIANSNNQEQVEVAEKLYKSLRDKGLSVLLDDRIGKKNRFGTKMKDFEIIGFPYAIVVGREIGDNKVEIVTRHGLTKELVDLDNVVNFSF